MTTKLLQTTVEKLNQDHAQGLQPYDDRVPRLRVVVGKKASTLKF